MAASETTKAPEIESNLTKLLAFYRKQPWGSLVAVSGGEPLWGGDTERHVMRALVVLPGSWTVGWQKECRGVSGTQDFSLAGRFMNVVLALWMWKHI